MKIISVDKKNKHLFYKEKDDGTIIDIKRVKTVSKPYSFLKRSKPEEYNRKLQLEKERVANEIENYRNNGYKNWYTGVCDGTIVFVKGSGWFIEGLEFKLTLEYCHLHEILLGVSEGLIEAEPGGRFTGIWRFSFAGHVLTVVPATI